MSLTLQLEPLPAALPTDTVELAQWFVLRTKSRQEKALAAELQQRGIQCFLPLARQIRFHGKDNARRAVVEEPLIPGYLFLYGDLDCAYRADRSRRTAQLIKVPDQAKLSWEIENLRAAVGKGIDLQPHPLLQVGTKVEIRSGPLRGIQGVVDSRRGNRLVLQISALGQALSLEIDGALLDRMEG